MDFELSQEQRMIRDAVEDFCKKELIPIANEIDKEDKFPQELIRKMAELGFLGIPLPEEFGGGGSDTLSYLLAIEEMAKISCSVAITVCAHVSLATESIAKFGNQMQKEKFLKPMACGEKLGAFCLTEPNIGSDIANIETIARFRDGFYFLNGAKILITNAGVADIYLVFASTDRRNKDVKKRLSAFIVEKGTEGFSFGERYEKMGWRGSETQELIFENAKVPAENIFGRSGEGFLKAMEILDSGRIGIAAMALGLSEGAFNAALKYSKERKQFGKPINDFQLIQSMLADMITEIEAARYLIWKAAYLKDKKKPFRKEASMAKLFASETCVRAVSKAVQIHGGSGYIKGYAVERFYRDAKIFEIGEGTSEMQRLIIARSL